MLNSAAHYLFFKLTSQIIIMIIIFAITVINVVIFMIQMGELRNRGTK